MATNDKSDDPKADGAGEEKARLNFIETIIEEDNRKKMNKYR